MDGMIVCLYSTTTCAVHWHSRYGRTCNAHVGSNTSVPPLVLNDRYRATTIASYCNSDVVALVSMSVPSAVTVVADINEYLRGQATVLKASSFKVVQAGQLRSLLKTLSTCASISVDDAPAIVDEIGNGTWDDTHKDMLATAIDRLVTGGQAAVSHSTTRKVQSCAYIEHYLTDTDYSKILDMRINREKRYDACAKIFVRIHMPCPGPWVKRRIIGIMSSADEWMQNPLNAKKALDKLGDTIRNTRDRNHAHAHVECFPDDPADMDSRIPGYMESVYAEEPPSVELPVSSDGIDDLIDGRCLRGTHKTVRATRPDASAITPWAQPLAAQPNGFDMNQAMHCMMGGVMQFLSKGMGKGCMNTGDNNNVPSWLSIGGSRSSDDGAGGGATGASSELAQLQRSRTDNFWKRRADAASQNAAHDDRKRQHQMDAPANGVSKTELSDGDEEANADNAAGTDEETETPANPDNLSDLEALMRRAAVATAVTKAAKDTAKANAAKAKAQAKAMPKVAAKVGAKAKIKAAPPVLLPCGKAKGKVTPTVAPSKRTKGAIAVAVKPHPYKGPKLEPLLTHILCKARLDMNPTRGAFLTAGSNNAARALKLKGHNAADQKAAGRKGWALAAAYWDKHHKD